MLIISRADNMRVGISALPIIPSLTGGAEAEAGDYEIYLSWLAEFLLHKGTEVRSTNSRTMFQNIMFYCIINHHEIY